MEPGPAPVDPRTDLPAFGSMPTVERVDEVATRVLAPNASPMTLDGTNTYVLDNGPGSPAVVVDPGPDDAAHRAAVEEVLSTRDLDVAAVVVTHHHLDHAEAAPGWAGAWGVPVVASRPEVAGPDGRVVAAGDVVPAGTLRLEVVPTPGHTVDSISLRLPTGSVCTGDHVLGRGTSVVAHPDGTLTEYLESLRRVLDLGPAALLPGHGPAMHEDPSAVLRFHLEHRAYRLAQVLAVLADGPATVDEVVAVLYADVPRAVWPAAAASTRAAVDHLAQAGKVVLDGDRAALP